MSNYPQPNFHFTVEWGGTKIGFTEVSGLSMEAKPIEYRAGGSPEYHTQKMPGQVVFSNVILKRGITAGDNEFFAWFNTRSLNTIERRDISIKLLDENHNPVMVWRIRNSFPVRLSYGTLNAMGNDVALEELEITHEGMVVETP
jgi:phage tail-like protein